MSPIISEIVKINVGSAFKLDSPAFKTLRDTTIGAGVQEQYYGNCMDDPTTLYWVIQWPGHTNPLEYKGAQWENFRESIKKLDVKAAPFSCYIPFESADSVRPALLAPCCELGSVHLTCAKSVLSDSLHKTFTDCYFAPGFKGGNWGTTLNDDKLHYYYLGWESRKHHHDYTKTELFAVEIDKITVHMDIGTTAHVKMTQQLS